MTRPLRRLGVGLLAVLALVLSYLLIPGFTLPLTGPAPVASLETVTLGGWPQSILIRGRDRASPILLFLHGGPGMPAMYLHYRTGRRLEDGFVVVHWDQRGAGRSYRGDLPPETMTVERILGDAEELMGALLERFGQRRLFLVGHSWGSYLGTILAQRHPDRIWAYVGIGQVTDPEREVQVALEWCRRRALERGDSEAARELERLGEGVLEKWLFRFGGELQASTSSLPLLMTGLFSPEYGFEDGINIARGSSFSSATMRYDALEGPLSEVILKLEVPVFFFQGRTDYVTPSALAAEYLDRLEAPRKELVWFERSSHFPFFEEPERFVAEMARVRDQLASASVRQLPGG